MKVYAITVIIIFAKKYVSNINSNFFLVGYKLQYKNFLKK